jgi:NitT/TauT family transport system ATP-binding protein
MDEPFGALDEMTREYHADPSSPGSPAETGAAVVLVTHSIPEAACSCPTAWSSCRHDPDASLMSSTSVSATRRSAREDLREASGFFEAVKRIREALHGVEGAAPKAAEQR